MKALTVQPRVRDTAALEDIDEPPLDDGAVLVETIAVGICGTDVEIVDGQYGEAPLGAERLVLGHESVGRVLEAPLGSGLAPGDHVVGIVRRPDPVPCAPCAAGEWDMCRNGLYTERGIKGLHGYCSERYRIEADFAVKVDPALGVLAVLLEPTSVVAKAWDHVMRISSRSSYQARTALVTGAGPIGLLAAMVARQLGFEVHVLDRVTDGVKPALTKALGAEYHVSDLQAVAEKSDVVIECTGVGQIVFDVMANSGPTSIVCLTGVSSSRELSVDMGALNRTMVLENDVVFGSVNANRSHYEAAATFLQHADRDWLHGLITRSTPLDRWSDAMGKGPDDIKVVIDLT